MSCAHMTLKMASPPAPPVPTPPTPPIGNFGQGPSVPALPAGVQPYQPPAPAHLSRYMEALPPNPTVTAPASPPSVSKMMGIPDPDWKTINSGPKAIADLDGGMHDQEGPSALTRGVRTMYDRLPTYRQGLMTPFAAGSYLAGEDVPDDLGRAQPGGESWLDNKINPLDAAVVGQVPQLARTGIRQVPKLFGRGGAAAAEASSAAPGLGAQAQNILKADPVLGAGAAYSTAASAKNLVHGAGQVLSGNIRGGFSRMGTGAGQGGQAMLKSILPGHMTDMAMSQSPERNTAANYYGSGGPTGGLGALTHPGFVAAKSMGLTDDPTVPNIQETAQHVWDRNRNLADMAVNNAPKFLGGAKTIAKDLAATADASSTQPEQQYKRLMGDYTKQVAQMNDPNQSGISGLTSFAQSAGQQKQLADQIRGLDYMPPGGPGIESAQQQLATQQMREMGLPVSEAPLGTPYTSRELQKVDPAKIDSALASYQAKMAPAGTPAPEAAPAGALPVDAAPAPRPVTLPDPVAQADPTLVQKAPEIGKVVEQQIQTSGGVDKALAAAAASPAPQGLEGYWGGLDSGSKMLAMAGLSIAAISAFKSMFSSGGEDGEEGESWIMKVLPYLGIGAAAWGLGGGTLSSLPKMENYKQFANSASHSLGTGQLFH